jgi:phosphohistidine phosphatase
MVAGTSRKLLLLRHAKSAWPDVPDHERPLARRGVRDGPVMGCWLRTNGHVPSQVLCSTARRASETWQLVQAELGVAPPVTFTDDVYQGSAIRLLDLIRQTGAAGTLLVIGHDPALPQLAIELADTPAAALLGNVNKAGSPAMADRMRSKFPTAAIAVVEFTGSWDQIGAERAWLTNFVTPRDLRGRR